MKNKRTVYFLCSPNIGLLDNWLPVIYKLRKLNNNFNYVLILSHARNVSAINLDNLIIKIADDVFNFVIIHSPSDMWVKVDSVNYVANNNFHIWKLLEYSLIAVNKFSLSRKIYLFFKKICKVFDKIKYRNNAINLKSVILENDILLYDIHTYLDPIDFKVISKFNDSYRFSMSHGISFKLDYDNTKKINIKGDNNKLKIFLFSKSLGYEYYLEQYSITHKNLIIGGIPRHDQSWIDKIQGFSNTIPPDFDDRDTIFIASRPVCNYIPKERKVKIFKDIKRVIIDKLHMKVIVKMHPKELKDPICEDIFGRKEFGKTWVYSDLHPFVLGKGKRLAITFNSAISFDMLRLGVPCIEYINLQGIPNMNSITEYARHGVVIGVDNYKDFKFQVGKVLNSSNYTSHALRKYKDYFTHDSKSSMKVASEIIESINNK